MNGGVVVSFSKRLLNLLDDNDMSQKELAQQVGVTPAAISRYVTTNRLPPGQILCDIAVALNTSTDYLLGLDSCYCSKLSRHELSMIKAFIKAYRKYNKPPV